MYKKKFYYSRFINEHDILFKTNYNENMRLNRVFVKHLINFVLFLGKQELPFCGFDKINDLLNKENFRMLFNMHIITYTQEIQNYLKKKKNIFSFI